MPKKEIPTTNNESEIAVTIRIKKGTHKKVKLKQLQKFDNTKTLAEVCALAVEKGIDNV